MHVVRSPTSSDGDGPPRPSDEVMAAIRDAEVYYGFGIPRAALPRDAATALGALGGGRRRHVDAIAEMAESDVVLTNSAGIHADSDRRVHRRRRAAFPARLRHGRSISSGASEWNKTPFVKMDSVLREMDTVRALIIGVGGLGGAAAERLSALGARCTGVRRRVGSRAAAGFERVVGLDQLDAELPKHDVVVLAAPLTTETASLLTAERLDLLPPQAIVVNVARGAQLDEGRWPSGSRRPDPRRGARRLPGGAAATSRARFGRFARSL